jgi:hypothetical protein
VFDANNLKSGWCCQRIILKKERLLCGFTDVYFNINVNTFATKALFISSLHFEISEVVSHHKSRSSCVTTYKLHIKV